VPTAAVAARATGGEFDGGEHEQAGGRVEVAGLAPFHRGPVRGEDRVPVGLIGREAAGMRLVDAAGSRHPSSVARTDTVGAMSTLGTGPTIFHNPRCSKSRAAMATAEELGVDVEEVRYLDAPPDRTMLEAIVAGLEDEPTDLIRQGDANKVGVDTSQATTPAAVVDLLVEHPELMERPVVWLHGRAIIGRPTERVAPFLRENA
jgi:arsenate reductase